MTKTELKQMVDEYEDAPEGTSTCDLLCEILDELPGQPEGEYSADEIREMIEASKLED